MGSPIRAAIPGLPRPSASVPARQRVEWFIEPLRRGVTHLYADSFGTTVPRPLNAAVVDAASFVALPIARSNNKHHNYDSDYKDRDG